MNSFTVLTRVVLLAAVLSNAKLAESAEPDYFKVGEREAFVIEPPEASQLDAPMPWVFYAPTFIRRLPGPEEDWMIRRFHEQGIAIAGIDVGESYGSPNGRAAYQMLYEELTEKRGYAKQCVLLARSRGGLMLYNWAVEHPNCVAGVAGIYPVCNIESYPGVAKAAGAYEMTTEQLQDRLAEHNPLNRLAPLAKAKVPILHIHGDQDRVVPLEKNSAALEANYRKLGGPIEVEVIKDQGHNMWDGWFQSEKLTRFITMRAVEPRGVATTKDFTVLKSDELEVVIGNNKSLDRNGKQHRAGYNGIFSIKSTSQAESPFVPAYAGLNLEHYFDGRIREEREQFFEPRFAPMDLRRVDRQTVELYQPMTADFQVDSWTRFSVESNHIDFSFRCKPHRTDYEGDFLGTFWASYINGPLDKSIYFLDGKSNLQKPIWQQLCTQTHNRDSTLTHVTDTTNLDFDAKNALFAHVSPLKYSAPFFYGRFRNMVLIYVFQPDSTIRFTHSPSGGGRSAKGDDTNPAWDFQLIVPQPKAGREYELNGRLIYKEWKGRDDVLAEVAGYLEPDRAKESANKKVALNQKADGYRGIWYMNQPSGDEYVYKYSGGLGTYCAKHKPFAIYSKRANKTFFCYGGATESDSRKLMHMVSYFDHATGTVPKPTLLLDKRTNDAHDNPVISIDDTGHIWIFSTSHGRSRPSYIHRSKRPFDINEFELIPATRMAGDNTKAITNFSYMQVWHSASGFDAFFTRYKYPADRTLCFMHSSDGRAWSDWQRLAAIDQGHYQVSGIGKSKIGSQFNYHPQGKGLNWRTNLYYIESSDHGSSWQTVDGRELTLPLTDVQNDALVMDYESQGLNVYLKDLRFDAEDRPVLLYITSKGYQSGPANDPRTWRLARWTENEWKFSSITASDNNYDMGELWMLAKDDWRVLGPTEQGPQPYNPGGEVAMWQSTDQGATWSMMRQLTKSSERNHTYVRRALNAHPDFIAIWADGHGRKPSESRLYFANASGDVFQLPEKMTGDCVRPLRVK